MVLRGVEVWYSGSGLVAVNTVHRGAGQRRSGPLALGGAPAQRGSIVGVCCMPEPPIHVCISTVLSCSCFFYFVIFAGLGDYIGLPAKRVSTAASLSPSSKFCVYPQGEPMTDSGVLVRFSMDVWKRKAALTTLTSLSVSSLHLNILSCYRGKSPELSEV